ncbi:MAG: sugar ABC transporter ATP-binding protein [Actinobacteria bacterium]|nr:MAG: sugar ABC transporter ATP-binding protein [Actinomycetota bacterium]
MSSNAVEVSQPVIEARGITKRYGALTALHGVDLSVRPGEVVGLVGDNGAGKSTLIKILSGALEPTDGAVLIDGRQADLRSPLHARQQGIETVYQDLALAPDLTVAENLFIGRELKRADLRRFVGTLDRKRMNRHAQEQLERLRIRIDAVTDRADTLSGGQRQAIAVARAVAWGRRIILMDEPTAALGVEEQQKVAELIDEVRRAGTPVLLVSHNIPQVHEICDRIVVLFHGRVVADLNRNDVDIEDVVMWITGAALRINRDGGNGRGSSDRP